MSFNKGVIVKWVAFIILLIGLLLQTPLRAEDDPLTLKKLTDMVGWQLLQESERIALDIIEKCPPRRCVILSLGNSSALMESFLRVLSQKIHNGDYVYEIPFSKISRLDLQNFNPQSRQKAFDLLLPDESFLKGRDVMVFRVLMMGISMSATFEKIINKLSTAMSLEKIGVYFVKDDGFYSPRLRSMILQLKMEARTHFVFSPQLAQMAAFRKYDESMAVYSSPIEEYHRYKPIVLQPNMDPAELIRVANEKSQELDYVVKDYLSRHRFRASLIQHCKSLLKRLSWK